MAEQRLSNLYLDVVKPYCRTCHSARARYFPLDPANPSLPRWLAATFSCGARPDPPASFRHFMPHAERTMARFWSSSARAVLINALNDGTLDSAVLA